MLRKSLAVLALGTGVLTTGIVSAQQAAQPRQIEREQRQQERQIDRAQRQIQRGTTTAPATTVTGAQNAQGQNADQSLATCVAISNQKEVALAQFAAENAKHEEVKEFAEKMVQDHQAFLEKLAQFSPAATQNNFLHQNQTPTEDRRDTTSTQSPTIRVVAANQADEAAAQPAVQVQAGQTPAVRVQAGQTQVQAGQPQGSQAYASTGIDLMQLDREVAQECLKNSKEELSKKDGAEFDQCFVGFQIAAHAAMRDKLVVYQRHASPELKAVLAEGEQTTKEHMKHAEKLMKQLADSSDTSARERREERRDDRQEERQSNE